MTCCSVGGPLIFYRGSLEYLYVEVTADVVLSAQPVEFSLTPGQWFPATWQGSPGMVRTARALVDFGNYYKGTYQVRARVTDNPEIPVFGVGTVQVRA